MISALCVMFSVDKNLEFITGKAGGTPTILTEGQPGTGKTTQAKIKCMLWNRRCHINYKHIHLVFVFVVHHRRFPQKYFTKV